MFDKNYLKMKIILNLFKAGATIMFYALILFSIVLIWRFADRLINSKPDSYITINDDSMRSTFTSTGQNKLAQYIYSTDKSARYIEKTPTYSVDVKPNTVTGLYYMISSLIFMIFGILILWMFKKIFTEIKIDSPFKASVVRHLQVLASLFIASELLGFIHYFILSRLINKSVELVGVHQIAEKGSSLFIGCMILIIALVYKRGLEIYEENCLTV